MLLGTVSLVIEDTPDSQRMQAMLVDGPHIFYANYSPTGCFIILSDYGKLVKQFLWELPLPCSIVRYGRHESRHGLCKILKIYIKCVI